MADLLGSSDLGPHPRVASFAVAFRDSGACLALQLLRSTAWWVPLNRCKFIAQRAGRRSAILVSWA